MGFIVDLQVDFWRYKPAKHSAHKPPLQIPEKDKALAEERMRVFGAGDGDIRDKD